MYYIKRTRWSWPLLHYNDLLQKNFKRVLYKDFHFKGKIFGILYVLYINNDVVSQENFVENIINHYVSFPLKQVTIYFIFVRH